MANHDMNMPNCDAQSSVTIGGSGDNIIREDQYLHGIPVDIIRTIVKVDERYYINKFLLMERGPFSGKIIDYIKYYFSIINWAAFFSTIFFGLASFLLYSRMYLYGISIIIFEIVCRLTTILLPQKVPLILLETPFIIISLAANIIYRNHIFRMIKKKNILLTSDKGNTRNINGGVDIISLGVYILFVILCYISKD